ncbi:MAG: hypothetical protein EOM03_14220 [Clostridia bacterium]|nr:hypothetical protein [Clostridia bacterium]
MRNPDPAKELLLSVREAGVEKARLRKKIARLESQTERMTASLTGMPHGGNADAEKMWATLADLKTLYNDKLVAAELTELEVSDFIDRLPNDTQRIILRLRYLGLLSWPAVQRSLLERNIYYEIRQIYRLHGEALNAARELWSELYGEGEQNE